MAGLNILIEAIVFIAECVILSTITDASFARIMYIVLAIVSVVLAIFEVVLLLSLNFSLFM